MNPRRLLFTATAAALTAPWEETWGKGFVKPETFTTVLYTELSKPRP